MTKRVIAKALLLASTSLAAGSVAATAQDTAAAGEEEIVVTARKRAETLMKAPITVQALTPAQIARNPTSDLTSLAAMLPNVTAARTGSGTLGAYSIRGIGGSSGDSGVDQAITVVIDDMPIARGTAAASNYFDLASIQVLPGPQSLYFGKNASGGIISLKTADPTDTFQATVRAGYEANAGERYLDGFVSGPISDEWGARLAFRLSEMDGWMKNTAGPINNPYESNPDFRLQPGAPDDRLGGSRSAAARLTLTYEPSPNFSATLKAMITRFESDELSGNVEIVACGSGYTTPHQFDLIDPYGDCEANGRTAVGAMNPALAQYFPDSKGGRGYGIGNGVQGSLRMEYDAGPVLITSVTGYYDMNYHGLGNFSYSSFDYFAGVNTSNEKVMTQEIRANTEFDGPVNFIVGGYVDKGDRLSSTIGRGLIFGFLPPINASTPIAGADVELPTAIGYYPQHEVTTHTYSVFGQVTWDISDSLKIDAGVRYTKVTSDSLSRNRYIAPFYLSLSAGAATGAPCNSLGLPLTSACLFVPPTERVALEFDESNVSPEVTVTWQPSDNLTIYAAYKTGYKPGAISNPSVLLMSNLGGDPERNLQFGAEESKGGELGVKATLLEGDLQLSSSIYYYQFDGLQLSTFDSTTTSFLIRNAGSAVTRGAEVQFTYRATSELTLRGSVNYNDAYFSDYRNVACHVGQTAAQGCNVPVLDVNGNPIAGRFSQDLTGFPLAAAPLWVVIGGVTWDKDIGSGLMLGVDADFKYSDDYRTNNTGTPLAVQDSYVKVNARVRLSGNEDMWEVALIGRNLTNEYVVQGATATPGTGNAQDGFAQQLTGTVERAREIGLQFTLRL